MKEEFDLTHSDLSFLEDLANYTFESKMLFCQAYSSRIMTSSEVSAKLMLTSNIMPWELEAFAAFLRSSSQQTGMQKTMMPFLLPFTTNVLNTCSGGKPIATAA